MRTAQLNGHRLRGSVPGPHGIAILRLTPADLRAATLSCVSAAPARHRCPHTAGSRWAIAWPSHVPSAQSHPSRCPPREAAFRGRTPARRGAGKNARPGAIRFAPSPSNCAAFPIPKAPELLQGYGTGQPDTPRPDGLSSHFFSGHTRIVCDLPRVRPGFKHGAMTRVMGHRLLRRNFQTGIETESRNAVFHANGAVFAHAVFARGQSHDL